MSHCLQRVMAWPGGVRFHYGHPDLWNRLWVMTRGGVSKSTRWPPLLLETALVPSAPLPMSKPNKAFACTSRALRPLLSLHLSCGPVCVSCTFA